jgi:ATP phosphoribosyltransferase
VIIANKQSWEDPWKRRKIEQIATLLQAALRAENMVGLKMNVPKDKAEEIIRMLPSLNYPTVSGLYNEGWVSIESVLNEKEVRNIIPELIRHGAEGIIEYPLNKII